MKRTKPFVSSGKFPGLLFLLVVAFALAFMGVQVLARIPQVAAQPAGIARSQQEVDLRNRHLLEVNEGIRPIGQYRGGPAAPAVVKPAPRDTRYRHLMEVNEGYAPTPVRTPRDQRLYEINRW